MSDHWANNLIGLPWVAGARGPQAFDCWGLAKHIYHEQFGIDLLDHCTHDDPHRRGLARELRRMNGAGVDWREIPSPVDGCMVAMARGQIMDHVGVWAAVDGGLIVHSKEGAGVIAQKPATLIRQGVTITYYLHDQHQLPP